MINIQCSYVLLPQIYQSLPQCILSFTIAYSHLDSLSIQPFNTIYFCKPEILLIPNNMKPIMRLSTLFTIASATGALAFPQVSSLSYPTKRALPTGASQAPNPTAAPAAPSSVTFEGSYTLPSKPTECTDSSIPFETSIWIHGNQLTVEDDGGSGSWVTKDKSDWTFSTNTSDIVFGSPYFVAGGGCARGQPCPTVANRTQPNSFSLTTSSSGKRLQIVNLTIRLRDYILIIYY